MATSKASLSWASSGTIFAVRNWMGTVLIEEHLLGFDARAAPSPWSWSAERRSSYLLRLDVQSPLSTDTMVWPSLYDQGSEAERLGLPMLQPPGWRGPNADLWDNLGALQGDLDKSKAPPPYWLIAVAWVADEASQREPRSYGPYVEPMTPSTLSPAWTLLGFDVADDGRLSGLTDCGYGVEQGPLKEAWSPRINEHHLFGESEDALAFRLVCNERVPEHAPFFAYGLWLIEKVERP